jgi:hypothetical protein
MKPVLLDPFDPVTNDDISLFEQELDISLPIDYRQFLLRTNGGVFHDEVCDENFKCVESLYGLAPTVLRGYYADLRKDPFFDVNRTLLRIGNNDMGDQLLLRIVGSDYGTIWIHQPDFDSEDNETTVRPVAPSFGGFLNNLRLHPDRDLSDQSHLLFRAIEDGDEDAFFEIFDRRNVRSRSDEDWPILSFACRYHRIKIVRFLIEEGADVEEVDSSGETSLFFALRAQSFDIPRLLLDNRANVNSVNSKGESALMVCLSSGNDRGALLLIQSGADTNYKSPDGKTVWDCTTTRDPLVRSWLEQAQNRVL